MLEWILSKNNHLQSKFRTPIDLGIVLSFEELLFSFFKRPLKDDLLVQNATSLWTYSFINTFIYILVTVTLNTIILILHVSTCIIHGITIHWSTTMGISFEYTRRPIILIIWSSFQQLQGFTLLEMASINLS